MELNETYKLKSKMQSGKKAFAVEQKVTFDYCAISGNGTLITDLAELDTELKDGDTIKLFPNIYGG